MHAKLGSVLFAAILACPIASLAASAASSSPTTVSSEPKTHTLYMGADFAVEWQGGLRPVEDVKGSTFVVDVDGHKADVPSLKSDLRIKMESNLKVTTLTATIGGFSAERAYTPAADPRQKTRVAAAMADNASAATDAAAGELRTTQSIQGFGNANAYDAAGNKIPWSPPEVGSQMGSINSSVLAERSNVNSVPDAIFAEQTELARQLFDAFRLNFEISTQTPVANPYLIAVVRYRENAERPNTGRMLIYAQALPRLEAKPTKVQLFRGGFPPGYTLDEVVVHIYDGRSELATNLSPKRVELTKQEAFEVSLVDYIGRNHDQTLGPSIAVEFLPPNLRQRIPTDRAQQKLYVKVSKNGKSLGAFHDAACQKRISDAELDSVLDELRFRPALNKGKLAESVAAMTLAQAIP